MEGILYKKVIFLQILQKKTALESLFNIVADQASNYI